MHRAPPADLSSILLVTDISVDESECVQSLERCNYPFAIAWREEDVRRRLDTGRTQLILVEAKSDTDSLDMCRTLRSIPMASRIPLLLVLTSASEEQRRAVFLAGASDYLVKPLLAEEMAAKVTAHLRLGALQLGPGFEADGNDFHATREFHTLVESLPENVIRYDREGKPIYFSPAFRRMAGPNIASYVGKTVREAFPDGTYDDYAEVLDRVLATGEEGKIEIPVPVVGKASLETHQIRFVPELDDAGQVSGVLAIGRDVTDRKRIERDLVLLDRAINAASDAVFLMDQEGRFLYVNRAACQSLGYEREKLLGLCPLDIDPKVTPESFQRFLTDVFSVGPSQGIVESRHRRRDGSTFPVELSVSVVDLDGTKHCLVIARDVTERYAAAEKLHANEQALRAIVENSPDFIIRYDEQGRRLYMNQAVLRVIERPWEELRGTHLSNDNPALDVDTYAALVRRTFETGEEVCKEIMGQNKHGVVKWRHMRFVPERDQSGKVVSVLAVARDINELKQSEERFRTLADHSPNIIIRYDTDLRRIYANPAYERETEFKVQQVLMTTPADYWWNSTSLSATEYQDKLREVLTSGQPAQFEMSWSRPSSGERVHHSMQMVPEYNWKREVIGVLCIGHDITPIKAAEQRLRESYDLLKELASHRETAREEERKRIAREIHDELGQRLTALKLKIAVLRLQFGESVPTFNDAANMLLDTVDQAVRVVRNLSALLRPAAIELGVVPSLEWLASEFQRNSGIPCELGSMPTNLSFNEEAAIALFRVAQESLTNVTRHARASRVRITLEQQDDCHVLEIADDGIGFEVDSRRNRTFGLAGIRERMLAVGGDATVESAPGRGTRVRVSLPARAWQDSLVPHPTLQ